MIERTGIKQMGIHRAMSSMKGPDMYAIGKKVLVLVLLVLLSAAPLACLTIDKGPDDNPRKETKVGGDNGVVVKHGGGEGSDVRIGGDRGVGVDH
jgi:hypothetical protein